MDRPAHLEALVAALVESLSRNDGVIVDSDRWSDHKAPSGKVYLSGEFNLTEAVIALLDQVEIRRMSP